MESGKRHLNCIENYSHLEHSPNANNKKEAPLFVMKEVLPFMSLFVRGQIE